VSCYYLNQKLEFFGIASAQVGGIQIAKLELWVPRMESEDLFPSLFIIFKTLLCCASYLFYFILFR